MAFEHSDLAAVISLLAVDGSFQFYPAKLRRESTLRWQPDCPAWLANYTAWHAESLRKSASSMHFMLHQCTDTRRGHHGCPGIGDRLRGLMETLAWAVHTRRTFLLRWEAAAPLEAMLTPASLDWRVLPGYRLDALPPGESVEYRWLNKQPVPHDISSDAISRNRSLRKAKLLAFTHPLQGCMQLPAHARSSQAQGGQHGPRRAAAAVAAAAQSLAAPGSGGKVSGGDSGSGADDAGGGVQASSSGGHRGPGRVAAAGAAQHAAPRPLPVVALIAPGTSHHGHGDEDAHAGSNSALSTANGSGGSNAGGIRGSGGSSGKDGGGDSVSGAGGKDAGFSVGTRSSGGKRAGMNGVDTGGSGSGDGSGKLKGKAEDAARERSLQAKPGRSPGRSPGRNPGLKRSQAGEGASARRSRNSSSDGGSGRRSGRSSGGAASGARVSAAADGIPADEAWQAKVAQVVFVRKPLPGPDIGCTSDVPPHARSCLFHALFRPSPRLSRFVSRLRNQLLGSGSAPYVAVHLRLGGFEGEKTAIHRFGANVSEAVEVARSLAAAHALAAARRISAPVLVITDNAVLRQALQEGRFPGFVSPSYAAAHISPRAAKGGRKEERKKEERPDTPHEAEGGEAMVSEEALLQAQLTSFADLALLAGASCLIGSRSGFSHTALMWGRHSCFLLSSGAWGSQIV